MSDTTVQQPTPAPNLLRKVRLPRCVLVRMFALVDSKHLAQCCFPHFRDEPWVIHVCHHVLNTREKACESLLFAELRGAYQENVSRAFFRDLHNFENFLVSAVAR